MPVLRLSGALLAFSASLVVAGCGSSVSTGVPTWAGGLPQDAPARAAAPPVFPDVYDVPPPRATRPMTAEEQAKLQAELTALRRRVNAQADALERQQAR